jgi:ATP-dependent protease HslVU (ClpYQ) peptidase subunit
LTTIVGYARNGAVYMAADTMTNVYERPIVGGARKLHRVKAGLDDEVLLGICGAGGLAGELPQHLKIDAVPGLKIDAVPDGADDPDVQAWAHTVARAITEIAVEAGLVDDGKLDGHLLLGWGGRLWTLTHTMAIPHPDGVAAIGSGEGPAIGALDALVELAANGTIPWDPLRFTITAAAVGIARDRYSGAPIDVEFLPRIRTGVE